MDDGRAAICAAGEHGEVVIQGPNVIDGYENNPEANATSFIDGWFRTGDQGFLDADGYLTLVGRIKELINRGGEKISPREIDEVLLAHPAVAEAVAFGVPHREWGEEVAAAVVLREARRRPRPSCWRSARSGWPTSRCRRRSTSPTTIPRTATGKIQRRVVAAGVRPESPDEVRHRRRRGDRRLYRRLPRPGRAADVTLFARGPHLRAMQERGLRVRSAATATSRCGRRSPAI